MKGLLLFLGLAVAGASAKFEPNLRLYFSIGLRPGVDFFREVPKTISTATSQKWSASVLSKTYLSSAVLYCADDNFVCGIYDEAGNLIGLNIAIPQDQFSGAIYDWTVQGYTEWVPTGSTQKYWATQQYFVSPDYLALDASERAARYNSSKLLQEEAVWLSGFNGVLDRVSEVASDIENSIFTKQACIPWMGRHYYYNMTTTTVCQADTIYPWFPLVHSGQLVGTGLIIAGKLTLKANQLNWFENPARLVVQAIVPDGPECLYSLASDPGLATIHVYYIDTPWVLGCLEN